MLQPIQAFLRRRRRGTEFRPLRNDRGVALVMAITAVALITYLAMEVMYDSTVEYTVNAQGLNRLKAYYAARSGLEISLLRVKIYQSINAKVSPDKLGAFQNYIDEIWRFPFVWPLQLPDTMSSMDKESTDQMMKESTMDASFSTSIQDEGSRTDLADLVSPSKSLQELTRKRLLDVFKRKVEDDEEWRRTYGSYPFEELINNIADWMSDKTASLNGGDKRSRYGELNQNVAGTGFPPNRAFRTLQELRLVAGMNDDFYDLLAPQVTIYGMRGINPNVATKEVLMSLDPGITAEIAAEIIARREDENKGGKFKSDKDFWDFVTDKGARLQAEDTKKIPLSFESLISFRIKSTGEFGGAVREIEVVTTDLDRTANQIKKYVDQDKKEQQQAESATAAPKTENQTNRQNVQLPKGPPRIVYWTER
ncbi:MAG: general secretion pathway protein GspK [Bdellovibrionaceae bacterium]|nr:general secretion pathway protein GspK [Pseudobdellovibrionaceae bacterium]